MKTIRFFLLFIFLGVILLPWQAFAGESSSTLLDTSTQLSSKPLTKKAAKLTSLAINDFASGDYDASISYFEAALNEMPNDRDILIVLNLVKYEKEKSQGLIKPSPNSKAVILLDALQAGRGDWQASIRHLENALLDEQDKDRLVATRDALVELKGIYEDEQFLQDSLDLLIGYNRKDATARLLREAFNNLEKGYFNEAMEGFKGALKLDPGDANIREMIAYVGGLQFSRYEKLSTWAENQKTLNGNLKTEALQREADAIQALAQSQEALRLSIEYDDTNAVLISRQAISIAQQALTKARSMLVWAGARMKATKKTRAAATNSGTGFASRLRGNVRIKNKQGSKTFDANTALKPGDEIRTGKNGFAELVMSDGSRINLDANTSFRIGDPNRKRSLYEKIIGRIHTQFNCIQRNKRPCRQICYRISNVNLCIRGTGFEIKARKDGPATLTIMDGLVEIIPDKGSKTVEVFAGQQVIISKDGKVVSSSLFDMLEFQSWWE